jgi:uncharacterized protein (DUF433 family)
MSAEVPYPHIVKPEGDVARLKRVRRVRVAQIVMDYQVHGWSPEEMCRQHPYLQLAEAYAAMAYYFDHQGEIEAEIAAELKEADEAKARTTPSPFLLRMRTQGRL